MTVICAVRGSVDSVVLGSDTLITGGHHSRVGTGQKWVHGRHVSIGTTGPYLVLRAVEHEIGLWKPTMDPHTIWKTMRKVLKSVEFKPVDKPESDDPPYWGFSFMFATYNRLLSFGGDGGGVDFGVMEFAARGAGCSHAEGAWSAMASAPAFNMSINRRVQVAVEAACAWDTSCGGPPVVRLRGRYGIS